MKFIKPLMIAFSVLIALLLGFAFAQTFFRWQWPTDFGAADYVISIALGIFCLLILIGAFGQKFRVKRLGNYFLHFGLVLFLIGCLVYAVTGEYVLAAVPVNENGAYNRVENENGEVIELGFGFTLYNFKIEYYEPVYDVYRVKSDGGVEQVLTDVEIEGATADSYGYYDFGKYGGKVQARDLIMGSSMQQQIDLVDGYVALLRMPVKKYTAEVQLTQGNTVERKELTVNHPLRKNGVKIYLMSYNEAMGSATILFKKDAGEFISLTGIVLTIAGAFMQCLIYPAIKDKTLPKRVKKGTLPEENKEGGDKA